MLCENCKKNKATVQFTQIINKQKTKIFLCEDCAKSSVQFDFEFGLGNLLYPFGSEFGSSEVKLIDTVNQDLVCPKCKMRFSDFKKLGKLGCENCYIVFKERLLPIIKRIHGANSHIGKIPHELSGESKISEELDNLKLLLNKAIQNEEYEKAAVIRDKIKNLESKIK